MKTQRQYRAEDNGNGQTAIVFEGRVVAFIPKLSPLHDELVKGTINKIRESIVEKMGVPVSHHPEVKVTRDPEHDDRWIVECKIDKEA